MSLIFESIKTDSIAQLSYVIGDDSAGTVAVIDPRPDCEIYLELARRYGVCISHIFETHIHADFMSGARELEARAGSARVFVSEAGGAKYGFSHEVTKDGDTYTFGETQLTARHTPGHTPEHTSFLVGNTSAPEDAWGVFSGDSLFVGSAGRPDLVHDTRGEKLPSALFETLNDFYKKLDDGVLLLPGHGAGSACGANISARPLSTIGYERKHNPFLQYEDFDSFQQFIDAGAPPEPSHYARLKKVNAEGPPLLHEMPPCTAMTALEFEKATRKNHAFLLDVRPVLEFGGGHIPGAINIANRPDLSTWAGWLLDPDRPLLLVVREDSDLDLVRRRLVRVGVTRIAGYLAGGMTSWISAGLPVSALPQLSVHELHEDQDRFQVLDVRSDAEYADGHLANARHIYLPDVSDQLGKLDSDRSVATFCGSGYRANIAASILKQAGFEAVYNVIGSMKAWSASEYPVERKGTG